ncbi:MAG: hypothetical protein ACI4I1_09130 [Oscillospiraceae bacterium]
MKKTKTTVIFAVICLLVSIVSFAVAGKCANSSNGIKQVEKLISACEAHKPNKIIKCFDESTADSYTFSDCVTTADYLKSCGIDFGLDPNADPESISVKDFTASSSVRNDSAASASLKTEDKRYPVVYISAEYTDKDGNVQTVASAFYLIYNAESGKIYSISAS